MNRQFLILFGEIILLASMQFAIGSVEMSSKFSVRNFSKDQETLQNAADALIDYIRVGLIWTMGVSVLFYAKHGFNGLLLSIGSNLAIIAWIYFSYVCAFHIAMKKYKLKEPTLSLFH